jgi:RNA polymerase sigma factor (sigma-70 family)
MTHIPGPTVPLYSEDVDRRWRSLLMAFFLRRVGDRYEAEDLTQETFARGARRMGSPDNSNIKSYLFTIGANLLRDRARRAVTHQLKAHDSLSDPHFDLQGITAEDREPERVLIAKETLQEVISALLELDERTRDIFVLFRLEKMKHRQIADLYGISVSAVEKQVVKATTHLAARLGKNG